MICNSELPAAAERRRGWTDESEDIMDIAAITQDRHEGRFAATHPDEGCARCDAMAYPITAEVAQRAPDTPLWWRGLTVASFLGMLLLMAALAL